MSTKEELPVSSEKSSGKRKQSIPWWKTKASKITFKVLAALAVITLLIWFFIIRPYVRTDDARIAADIIRIANKGISGQIIAVNVEEGDRVSNGKVVVELDHRTAEAQYQKAKARATFAKAELIRTEALARQNAVSKQQLDKVQAEAMSADADLKLAELALEYTTLASPVNGIVVQKLARIGNILETNQTAITIVDIDNAWVDANIEETSVGDVKPGQKVSIDIDEGGTLTGTVLEVRKATAATFALIPADNGSGNFIKLVQRIPVKIKLHPHPGKTLRVGQSVTIKIRVK